MTTPSFQDFVNSPDFTMREYTLAKMLSTGEEASDIERRLADFGKIGKSPIEEQAVAAIEKIRRAGFTVVESVSPKAALAAWLGEHEIPFNGKPNVKTYVYFIQSIGGGEHVKIGVSADPVRRLSDLQLSSPLPLRLLGSFEGTYETEARLHQQFASLRLHGEWFRPAQELLDAIPRLCRCGGAALVWPAYRDLAAEQRKPMMALRLYESVSADPRIFSEPRAFKEIHFAQKLKANRNNVRKALRWLIDNGYVVEHGRGANLIRYITLPEQRTCTQTVPAQPAA